MILKWTPCEPKNLILGLNQLKLKVNRNILVNKHLHDVTERNVYTHFEEYRL